MPSGPRFSDEQVASILRRAAEMQDAGPAPRVQSGADTGEILQIGAELGIEPGHIRAAIFEAQSAGPGIARNPIYGGPVRIEPELALPFELTSEDWCSLVERCRRLFGRIGTTTEVGGALEWTGGRHDLDEIHVGASLRNGSTVVRATSDMTGAALLLALSVVLATILSVLVVLEAAELAPWLRGLGAVLTAALGGPLYRWWFSKLCERRRSAVFDLFDGFDEGARESDAVPQRGTLGALSDPDSIAEQTR